MTYPQQQPTQPQAPGDPFSDPEKQSTGAGKPTLRVLGIGRLVAIVPLEKHRDQPNPYYKADKPVTNSNSPTRTYIVADVLVCDGQPFMYGGNTMDPDPAKHADLFGPFPVPGVIFGMQIDKKPILDDIPETQIGGGVILARLAKQGGANGGNPYWVLSKATPQDRAIASPIYQAYKNGQLPTHVPPPPAPAQNAGQPTYGYPAGQVPQTPPGMVPTPYGMAPAASVHPEYAAAVSAPGAQVVPMGGQVAPISPQQPQWPTSPAQYPQPINPAQPVSAPATAGYLGGPGASASGAAPTGSPYAQPDPWAQQQSAPPAPADVPVPGYEAGWHTFSEPQKQMIRAQAAQGAGMIGAPAPSYP